MYVVLLRFAAHKADAPQHMAGHQAWIADGVDAGVFLLVGSIPPGLGGAILAACSSPEELHARIAADPFVVHDVVTAEVVQIEPSVIDPRLAFLSE